MSVISNWQAMPGRLRILFGILAERGEHGETLEVLTKTIAPSGLGRGDDSTLFPNTLKEAKALGLIREQDDRVILVNCPIKKVLEEKGADALFKERIEQILLGEAAVGDSERGVVARGLAWLLLQSPYEQLDFGESHKTTLLNQLGGDGSTYDLNTKEAFQNLVYWGRYLGYCDIIGLKKSTVVPNPTRAMRAILDRVLTERTRITVSALLEGLAKWTPVLEGGEVRTEVESRLQSARSARDLSLSTSLALMRLKQLQLLKLEELSDADVYVLHHGQHVQRITHVSRG